MDQPGKVANPARGQLNRENEHSPVPVRACEFGLARRVQPSRPASACSSPYSGYKYVLIVVSRMFTFCASLSSGTVPPALRNKSPLRVIRGLSEPCKALGEMQTKMTVLLSSAVWIIQIAKTPPLRAPSSSPSSKGASSGRSGRVPVPQRVRRRSPVDGAPETKEITRLGDVRHNEAQWDTGGASKDYSYSSRTENLSIFYFSLPL